MNERSDGKEDESKTRAKKRERINKEKGFSYPIRTAKCSLSKLVQSGLHLQVIRDVVLKMNRIRKATSYIIKHQILSTIEAGREINWNIDPTYIIQIMSALQGLVASNMTDETRQSLQWLRETTGAYAPHQVRVPAFNQLAGFVAKSMIVNFRVHIKMHLKTALNNWARCHIRTIMTQAELKDQKKFMPAYLRQLDAANSSLSFATKWKEWKARLQPTLGILEKDSTDEDANNEQQPTNEVDYNRCLRWMWQLRREVEDLPERDGVPHHGIAIFPENSRKIAAIRFDTRVMAHLFKEIYDVKPADLTKVERKECSTFLKSSDLERDETLVWGEFFKLPVLRKLRKHDQFDWSITTNGVFVCVPFRHAVPKKEKPKKRPRTDGILEKLSPGFHSARAIIDKYTDFSPDVHWVGVDPGVRTILNSWQVDDGSTPLKLGQGEYEELSGLKAKKMTKRYRQSMGDIEAHMSEVPFRKTSYVHRFQAYVQRTHQVWDRIWAYESSMQTLRLAWLVEMRYRSWIDRFVQDLKNVADPNTVLLWGNGGSKGHFGALRGCGVKGPIKRLKKAFSRHFPVITVDEFRTSKCCWECGQELKHPWNRIKNKAMYGVSYCTDTAHHSMLNRDRDGARKIALRFLCQLKRLPLGVWERNSVIEPGTIYDQLKTALRTLRGIAQG